ncbi:hypothetical protein GJR88_04737 [Dietzia sp. DQ12-45-1b]|nr:hypothetical protein GJR88_04737 [Dietzia sp. DQ12-45-1b]
MGTFHHAVRRAGVAGDTLRSPVWTLRHARRHPVPRPGVS